MSYITHGFQDGEVLNAAELNAMDKQIAANTLDLQNTVEVGELTEALQAQTDQLVAAIQSITSVGGGGGVASIRIGTVTTLPAGSEATVINSGTETDVVLNFGIPRGRDGTVTSGDGTVTGDLSAAYTYTDNKFSELSGQLASHTHNQLAFIDQDVRVGANPTFGTVTANKIIGAVYA